MDAAEAATDIVPDPPPGYVYAASDNRPRGPREVDLCKRAASTDWLYMTIPIAADVLAIGFVNGAVKYDERPAVRMIGPAFIGLSWGATLGGGYLALPKCRLDYVQSPTPEGDVRSPVPIALSLALISGAMGAMLTGVSTGPLPLEWTTQERSLRIITGGVTGFIGALVPYLLPPRTWRAARELERIRLDADVNRVALGYTLRF